MRAHFGRYVFISYLMRSVLSQGPFQITFSSNSLYSGDPVTLTVSYGCGLLLSVSVDAFDGSLKKGSLSYVAAPLSSSCVGVFVGQTFTGYKTHPPRATNISVTLTARRSLELNYTCTAKVFNGSSFIEGTCESASIEVRGPYKITFNSNPVYSGDPVTLTVSYGSGNLALMSVDAFDGSLKKGSLSYISSPLSSSGVGVFDGQTFTGWQNHPSSATSISVTLTATPSLERNYNCTAKLVYGATFVDGTCEPAFLQIRVSPSPPTLRPSPIVFNGSDSGVVFCDSRNGTPAADVSLSVIYSNKTTGATNDSSESTSVILSSLDSLPNWHNALVTCRVTNHNRTNLNIAYNVRINYIIKTSAPGVIYRNESFLLDCSTYISYYPGVLYNWTVPPAANVNSSLSVESITVPQGHTGSFYCTATNNVTMASVVIVFTMSNLYRPSTTALSKTSTCGLCWIIGPIFGAIAVAIAVVLGVLCKRGHFLKGKKSGVEPSSPDQRSDSGSNREVIAMVDNDVYSETHVDRSNGTEQHLCSHLYVYDGPASWKTSTEHDSDADAFHFVDLHTQASGEVASHKGRAPSTSDAPAQDRHFAQDIQKPPGLLIAAEGVVSQLAMRTLRTTAVVEYSDRSCSLNDILEKVEQVVSQSSPKFKSVALLLHPAKVGVTLSEVDQAVLNSSSIQEEKGEKVRAFIARLAKICLDEHGGTRMDILNYSGKAPAKLSQGLTNLLGIPTTVSKDPYGVETPTDEKGGHAVVADTYFDRNNLSEIVYAELQQPSVKPQTQPRPANEPVIYSEIKR